MLELCTYARAYRISQEAYLATYVMKRNARLTASGCWETSHMRNLRRGDVVEICDAAEILARLDKNGKLEGLAFAPEMQRYCGRRFKVSKRLSNIMVEGIGLKTIKGAVILEGAKCNGEFHEGCSRACSLIWKEKWLRKIDDHSSVRITNREQLPGDGMRDFQNWFSSCQALSLVDAASRPGRSLIRTYLYDLLSGDLRINEFTNKMSNLVLLKTRDLLHRRNERLVGTLTRTPSFSLSLQPGEIVEVKSIKEILETLDQKGRNRGLFFTPEMLKYCNLRYRVSKRVNKLFDEATGEMRSIANTVVLDDVKCDGRAHGDCPRACNCLWREIWLKRTSDSSVQPCHEGQIKGSNKTRVLVFQKMRAYLALQLEQWL